MLMGPSLDPEVTAEVKSRLESPLTVTIDDRDICEGGGIDDVQVLIVRTSFANAI